MNRRQVLSIGTASLTAGLGSAFWVRRARGDDGHDRAARLLATARREARLQPLIPSPQLDETARMHAALMSERAAVSHFDRHGEGPAVRAWQGGFRGRVLGETLAETWETSEETMAFWLSHAPTRDVLMAPEARAYGVGAVASADGRVWWNLITGG